MVQSGDFSQDEIVLQMNRHDDGVQDKSFWNKYRSSTLSLIRPQSFSPIETLRKYSETVVYQRILIYDETNTPRVVMGKLEI